MQLSAPASSSSDLPIAAPALPGAPVSPPKDGVASSFDDLLPDQPGGQGTPDKKDPDLTAAGEGAAAILASWLAALAPSTPTPAEAPTLDGLNVTPTAGDAATSVSGETAGATATEGRGAATSCAAFTLGGHGPFDAVASAAQRALRAQRISDARAAATPASPSEVVSTTDDAAEIPAATPAATATATASTQTEVGETALAVAAEAAGAEVTGPTNRAATPATARAVKAAFRSENATPGRWEKIAAEGQQKLPERIPTLDELEKKILNTDNKRFAKEDDGLGIGIAMSRPAMFTTLFNHPQSTSVGATSAVVDPSTHSASPSATPSAEQASQAHRAMNVILTVADRLASSSRSSVQLNFSVGGADLSVRVEMRAGEVHATFRTDSAELRSALAAEWQSLSGDASRANRLADAVFAPASASGATPYNGEGTSQHRESPQRQAEVIPFPGIHGSALRPAAAAASAAPEFRPAALRPELNLYTFA